MLDFMEECLQYFYTKTKWPVDNQFSRIASDSQPILDFYPPQIPAYFSFGKHISPLLKSSYSIGLPSDHSISFLYSSIPISAPSEGQAASEWWTERRIRFPGGDHPTGSYNIINKQLTTRQNNGGQIIDLSPSAEEGNNETHQRRPHLLYGRLFDDYRMEYLFTKRIRRDLQFILSGLSSVRQSDSFVHCQLQRNAGRNSSELNFVSINSLLGIRNLYRLDRRWAIGGEFYYTGTENSGGLSLAVRFRDYDGCGNLSSYMLTLNPIMGHLGAVHTASAGRDLMMAVRYEFNMFSFDSDIAFGLHYAPEDKQQALKLRLGIRQGLAVSWEAYLSNGMALSVGAMTEFTTRDPHKSIGVELQYCLS